MSGEPLVERLARHLPGVADALVPAACRPALVAAAHGFPRPSVGLTLECHLGRGRVDLISRIRREDVDDALDGPTLSAADRALLSAWRDGEAALEDVPYVDLELDLDGTGRSRVFVCPCIEPLLVSGPAAIDARRAARGESDSRATAHGVLGALLPEGLDPALARTLDRTYDALGPGGYLHHVQPKWTRGGLHADRALRVIVSLPRSRVAPILVDLGWPGDAARVAGWADRLLADTPRADLDLDLGTDGARPRVALYAGFLFPDPRDPSYRHALRWFEDLGVLSSAGSEALWDHGVACDAADVPFHRALQFKLWCEGDGASSLKAYLSFTD